VDTATKLLVFLLILVHSHKLAELVIPVLKPGSRDSVKLKKLRLLLVFLTFLALLGAVDHAATGAIGPPTTARRASLSHRVRRNPESIPGESSPRGVLVSLLLLASLVCLRAHRSTVQTISASPIRS
jgi:hypothetical protein